MDRLFIFPRYLKLATLLLSGIVLLSACLPATNKPEVQAQPTQSPAILVTELSPSPTVEDESIMVPTPRGPDLVATDPATVSLASGGLQLVEFIRFT